MFFNKNKTLNIFLIVMIIGAVLGMASPIFAVELTEGMEEVLTTSQLPTTPLVTVIGNIIKWVLGFLGLIATIIIIIGGFQWMSSGGNQEKIDKAKKLMINGLIGLIIVLLAYSISWFIIRAIEKNIGPGEEGGEWGEEGPGNHYQLRGANYLVITSRSPKAGETVAQNTKVIVSFNQKLNADSFRLDKENCSNPTVYVQKIEGGNSTNIEGSIIVKGNSFIFIPKGTCAGLFPQCNDKETTNCNFIFDNNSCCGCFNPGSYRIMLKSGKEGILGTRSWGNTLGQDIVWTFTVGNFIDNVAPQIESALPLEGNTVARNAGIAVTFTKPIDINTLIVYNPCAEGQECPSWSTNNLNDATIKVKIGEDGVAGYFERLTDKSFMFRPTDFCPEKAAACHCFPANSSIKVEITNEVKGINCVNLDCGNEKCSWTFQTNEEFDLTGPEIISTSPTNQEKDIDRMSDVMANFNEAIDPTSINEDVFILSSMLAREITISEKGAIYKPYAILDAETNYQAAIYGGGKKGGTCNLNPDFAFGVRDIYGNSMEASYYRWSFKTSGQINKGNPYIDWIDPPSGAIGQCVTIHGYNLGCCPDGKCESAKQSQNFFWDYINGGCKSAADEGKIEFLTNNNGADVWQGILSNNILSWQEINRCCPSKDDPSVCLSEEECPKNYSPENNIVIRIPSDVKGLKDNIKIIPASPSRIVVSYGGGSGGWGESIGNDVVINKEGELHIAGYSPTTPYLWVANSNLNKVSKIKTEDGTLMGRYVVGKDPSRTTVDMNNDPWIANRGDGTVIKLDGKTGKVLKTCLVNKTNSGPRGVAVDREGNVWAGAYSGSPQLVKFSGDNNNCLPLKTCSLPSGGVYGLAIDREGYIWVSNRPDNKIDKVNPNSCEVTRYGPAFGVYGIAIDLKGDVWVADYNNKGGVYRIIKDSSVLTYYSYGTDYSYTRGVAVDKEGYVWVTVNAKGKVIKIDPTNGVIIGEYAVGNGPIGITGDAEANIWIVNYYGGGPKLPEGGCRGGTVTKLQASNGEAIGTYCVGDGKDTPSPYTYSDMAGYLLRFVTKQSATWQTNYNAGEIVKWDTILFKGQKPEGTSLKARFKTAIIEKDLENTAWSSYFELKPSEKQAIDFLGKGQWLGIELIFEANKNGESPIVSNLIIRIK